MSNVTIQRFTDVAGLYQNIKPIRGARSYLDLRPLGKRTREFERIVKISPTKYAFVDGYTGMSPHGISQYAPIVWELHPDGTETVSVRNGLKDRLNIGRRNFLDNYLPYKMWLSRRKDLYVLCGAGEYVLPKNKSRTDIKELKFRVVSPGVYQLEGPEYKAPRRVTKINKEEKQPYKQHVADYWAYYCAVAPMLNFDDWRYVTEMRRPIKSHDPEFCRKIVADPDNELRLNFIFILDSIGEIKKVTTPKELSKLRSGFMSRVNTLLGFTTTTTEE